MLDLRALSTPPAQYRPGASHLPPLVIGPTVEDWAAQRQQLRDLWLHYLGSGPEVVPLKPQVQEEVDLGFAVRSLVSYFVEPDCRVQAYLFVPRSHGPLPGVVVFHPTTNDTILQPAGLAPVEQKHFALKLAQRGFVTLAPRNFLWAYCDEGPIPAAPELRLQRVERLFARWPQSTGMGKMLWDGLRAVDYLLTVPQVDPQRLGCVGHSLGAKEVLYCMAFDDRLATGVFSEGGIGVGFSNWDALWYLGQGIHQRPDLEHHQLLALTAPRPLLLVGGGRGQPCREGSHPGADGLESWAYLQAARPAYQLLGDPTHLCCFLHDQGHWVPEDAEAVIYQWFNHFLHSPVPAS